MLSATIQVNEVASESQKEYLVASQKDLTRKILEMDQLQQLFPQAIAQSTTSEQSVQDDLGFQ